MSPDTACGYDAAAVARGRLDLSGKTVAVVGDTTSKTALNTYLSKNLVSAKVAALANREEAMKQLQAKQVDAFASDQIVLIGQIMQAPDPKI